MRFIFACSLLVATPALATDFQISPVSLALSAKTPSSFITLTNSSSAPLSLSERA